jgi:hypothetical protein
VLVVVIPPKSSFSAADPSNLISRSSGCCQEFVNCLLDPV